MQDRLVSRLVRMLGVSLLALGVAGCSMTDADLYEPGESGTATFLNLSRKATLWLGGCTTFVQEEWVGGEWVDRGGEFVCFWEGFARPVAPEESVVEPFVARDPGRWRLTYDVGFDCDPGAPLSQPNCRSLQRISSAPFEVADLGEEALCQNSGGTWDPLSCGDYTCGAFPECDAIIPGCDCGPGRNFVPGIGCEDDPACPAPGEQTLCESTQGIWDPTSCGHWQCGHPPICAAVIPGCNCGPSSVFVEEIGCVAVPCGAPQ